MLRTLTAISFSTFVPVMLTRRGMTIAEAGTAASIYLFAVGAGGFFGGPLADRFGARRVIILSLVAAVPFLALAPTAVGLDVRRDARGRRLPAAVHAAGERHLRARRSRRSAPPQCRR